MDDCSRPESGWRRSARVFDERAEEYDSWYDDSPLFKAELAALQTIRTSLPGPRMEIGVGPGRFAEQLGVAVGIDPAPAALQRAAKRGIMTIAGIGEQLPLRGGCAGSIFLLFTLCFLQVPELVLRECRRVLVPGGRLIIGLVPAASPLGRKLAQKKQQGNPYYAPARLRTVAETLAMLDAAGFTLLEALSAGLGGDGPVETARPGSDERADFSLLVAGKKENT
jgi:SAM-dependent methyltransferase